MKSLFTIGVLMACCACSTAQDGFAIVELFTSQGCSSCPPADKNLSELIDQAKASHKAVYGLSFHVDYWNYIGWKDPYSSKAYSQRQRNYAEGIAGHKVYTPQMVVNGKTEFVGSNKTHAEQTIQNALTEKHDIQIHISNLKTTKDLVTFTYAVNENTLGAMLNIALVERGIENYVSRGENNGRTLHHDNVVRWFDTVPLKKTGNFSVPLEDVNVNNSSIILYIQNRKWEVLAATGKALN